MNNHSNKKTCTKCNIIKDLGEFYKSTRGKFGLTSECKLCLRERNSSNINKKKDMIANGNYLKPTIKSKICNCCIIKKNDIMRNKIKNYINTYNNLDYYHSD